MTSPSPRPRCSDRLTTCRGTWRYERIDGPGHWMQLEAPDAVNELLLDFLPGIGLSPSGKCS